MTTLQAPAPHGARAAHDLWHALLPAPRRPAAHRPDHRARPVPRHELPARHLMTDPDVFDVFGEDDAA